MILAIWKCHLITSSTCPSEHVEQRGCLAEHVEQRGINTLIMQKHYGNDNKFKTS